MKIKLSNSVKEKILERFDFEPKDKINYFLVRCPSCGHKEAFIYKDSERIICNRRNKCSYSESIWNLSKDILKDKDVVEMLYKEYGNDNLKIKNLIEVSEKIEIPEGMKFFSEQKTGIMRDRAYNYLRNRGIEDEVINNLGYIYEPNTEFDKTIFIPFYEDGELVYFTTRDFTGTSDFKKYINPHKINSKMFVYNIDNIEYGGTVFIFEGVFCAMSLTDQVGTAMLSSDLGEEQAIKIRDRAPSKIVFVPDNDKAGKNTLLKNIIKFYLYKWPSLKIDILIYNIEGNKKDFNETGENYIDINKCVKWKRNKKELKWKRKSIF